MDDSDYKLPRTKLHQLLPDPYRSDINQSLFENLFNRFLTKSEIKTIIGYIGQGQKILGNSRQIIEPSIDRQSNQLQPLLYNKIGTTEHIVSWIDILNKLKRLGIDIDRFDQWGAEDSFNWIPPIDIDKLANYENYYWVDSNSDSQPEYITIENKCNKSVALVNFHTRIVDQYGKSHKIKNYKKVSTFEYQITKIHNGVVHVISKKNQLLKKGQYITIANTTNHNGIFQITSDVTYQSDYTLIPLTTEQISTHTANNGLLTLTIIDQIIINGNLADVFQPKFQFLVKNTTNPQLLAPLTTKFSSHDQKTNQTSITLTKNITNTNISGNIEIDYLLDQYKIQQNQYCKQTTGWDVGGWDDNSSDPLWTKSLDIKQTTSFFKKTQPSVEAGRLKWLEPTDELWEYSGVNKTWKLIYSNFSSIFNKTEGFKSWDYDTRKTFQIISKPANQWIKNNKWQHRSTISNLITAKQAKLPIIEYNSDLEINEWTYTQYQWKYRATTKQEFQSTDIQPSLIEITPVLTNNATTDTIIVHSKFGNLTDIFISGFAFKLNQSTTTENTKLTSVVYQTKHSVFRSITENTSPHTVIYLHQPLVQSEADLIDDSFYITPLTTSVNDLWTNMYEQWAYNGIKHTKPINHQYLSALYTNYNHPNISEQLTQYEHYSSPSTNKFILRQQKNQWTLPIYIGDKFNVFGVNKTKQTINTHQYIGNVVANTIVVNVWINDELQYENFKQNTSTIEYTDVTNNEITSQTNILQSITFDSVTSKKLKPGDVIIVHFGEYCIQDIGKSNLPIRTTFDSDTHGEINVINLSQYSYIGQRKTVKNQYPLFDMYKTNQQSALLASQLFGFKISQKSKVNNVIDKRLDIQTTDNFQFEQYLVDDKNNYLYGFRDFSQKTKSYVYNTVTNTLYQWDTNNRSTTIPGLIIDNTQYTLITKPKLVTQQDIDYNIAYIDIKHNKLFVAAKQGDTFYWKLISSDVHVSDFDSTIQSIWKTSNNNQTKYTPYKVDWQGRTFSQYKTQQNTFIEDASIQIKAQHPQLSTDEVRDQANKQWLKTQSNIHSKSGQWIGDWNFPDPVYYNNQNENRQIVSINQLFSHFDTIMQKQDKIPAFYGTKSDQLHLTQQSNINYGVGGKIKQYNGGFDALLSMMYIDNVTIPTLLEFVYSQYVKLLHLVKTNFEQQAVNIITSTATDVIVDIEKVIKQKMIQMIEQNTQLSSLYGDSTTFNINTKKGIKNWIITLPFLKIIKPVIPVANKTTSLITHHDGHISKYTINDILYQQIINQIINTPDNRSSDLSLIKTIGFTSTTSPPNTTTELKKHFGPLINREGIFWYHKTDQISRLYRLKVISINQNAPDVNVFPEGSYWIDINNEKDIVKKNNGTWINVFDTDKVLSTDTISMWEEIDISSLLLDVIVEIEQRLYDAVPSFIQYSFDFNLLTATKDNQQLFDKLGKKYFETYTNKQQIKQPFSNINYSKADPWTWNYKFCVNPSNPRKDQSYRAGATWRKIYLENYRTSQPDLYPWKMVGYDDKPYWWDHHYLATNNTWKPIMWDNIKNGQIPIHELSPTGHISTETNLTPDGTIKYNFLPINDQSTNLSFAGKQYTPGQLIPPYFLSGPKYGIFREYATSIKNPATDFVFGDLTDNEHQWKQTLKYQFDKLQIAFKMFPKQLIKSLLGASSYKFANLSIDQQTHQPLSHTRTLFHGEIVDNKLIQINGIIQWLINYNRFVSVDFNISDFRLLWAKWTTKLGYQFSSLIDFNSFQIAHQRIPFEKRDYQLTLKKSPGSESFTIDSFDVTVLNHPLQPSDANQHQWELYLNTKHPLNREIKYYDVINYPFSVDTSTNICTIFCFPIISIKASSTFVVDGDHVDIFVYGIQFTINDHQFVVDSSSYDRNKNQTNIIIDTDIPDSITTGHIKVNHRQLTWKTGDSIWFSTTGSMCAPIQTDNSTIGLVEYFVISINDTQFKIANTKSNALAKISIDLTSNGRDLYVGQIDSSFQASQGQHNFTWWKHYVIDKTNTIMFTPPNVINGIQQLINIIDGYSSYISDSGFVINANNQQTDKQTGAIISWQTSIEKSIDYMFRSIHVNNQILNNQHPINVNKHIWTFTEQIPQWIDGTSVIIYSSNRIFPRPIQPNTPYYIKIINNTQFNLYTTPEFDQSNLITTTTTYDVGQLTVSTEQLYKQSIIFTTINPFGNVLFFRPKTGIVSNLLTGPYKDVRNTQCLFDENGNIIDSDDLRIYRQDKQTQIKINQSDNNIQLRGADIYVDQYEHVLLFNNYTTEHSLIYDPFVGLNVTKFEVLVDKQPNVTKRPNLGGSYNLRSANSIEIRDNFEATVDNLRYLYDTYDVNENKPLISQGRSGLGYYRDSNFLSTINVNKKSQFLFWRGMIHQKGSIKSLHAYINSRRFIDAKIDEFWAYKISEFGNVNDKEYPEMYLTIDDVKSNITKIQFVDEKDLQCIAGYSKDGFDKTDCGYDLLVSGRAKNIDGFNKISLSDDNRWYKQPNQQEKLNNNNTTMYFELNETQRWTIDIFDEGQTVPSNRKMPYIQLHSDSHYTFKIYDDNTKKYIDDKSWDLNLDQKPTIRHNFSTDNIVVQWKFKKEKNFKLSGELGDFDAGEKIVYLDFEYIPFTKHIIVYKNGYLLQPIVDYVEQIMESDNETTRIVLGNEIVFSEELKDTDVIQVFTQPATLLLDVHYTHINDNILQFNQENKEETYENLIRIDDDGIQIIIIGQNINKETQDPAKLLDKKSETVIRDIQFWDPAKGFHSKKALHTVNLQNNVDPAVYTDSLIKQNDNIWNDNQIGTVWMDTNNLYYKPYYDDSIFKNINDRLRKWGELSDWSNLQLYEWVKSPVHPSEYNKLSETQAGDNDINEHIKLSGKIDQTLFEKTNSGDWIIAQHKIQHLDVAVEGKRQWMTLNKTLFPRLLSRGPTKLLMNQYYYNTNIPMPYHDIPGEGYHGEYNHFIDKNASTSSINRTTNDVTSSTFCKGSTPADVITMEYGIKIKVILAGGSKKRILRFKILEAPMSVKLGTKVTQISNTGLGTGFNFVVDRDHLDISDRTYNFKINDALFKHNDKINVYINGSLLKTDVIVPENRTILLENLLISDRVTFAKLLPTTKQEIEQYINTGQYKQQYQFTKLPDFDQFGNQITKYYFWVKNKNTRNINQTISPYTAQQQLQVIPDPYMITMNTVPAGVVKSEVTKDIPITKNIIIDDDFVNLSEKFINVGTPIDNVKITKNTITISGNKKQITDTIISPDDWSLTNEQKTISFSSLNVKKDDKIILTYNAKVSTELIDLPDRNTRLVIRGIRGLVTENDRYTIRFVRDFSLRDRSNKGDKKLELKQQHEQWKLIRKYQTEAIDRNLWNKITESIIGYKLTDRTKRIPSIEREVYDQANNTDTQYGLGEDQIFADGQITLRIINNDLNDSKNNFDNVDIVSFIHNNKFDTNDNIIKTMNAIYTTFPHIDINRIFFKVLHQACYHKKNNPDIFKTSYLSAHGVKIFTDVSIFDD